MLFDQSVDDNDIDRKEDCLRMLTHDGEVPKPHSNKLIRYGGGVLRCDKNSGFICLCGLLFPGCLFALNMEKAGLFSVALRKASGDKQKEAIYMSSMLKLRYLSGVKSKFALCCNAVVYQAVPGIFLCCPCYIGSLGRAKIQAGVGEFPKSWDKNLFEAHLCCSPCAIMQEARALKNFQKFCLDAQIAGIQEMRSPAAVAPMPAEGMARD